MEKIDLIQLEEMVQERVINHSKEILTKLELQGLIPSLMVLLGIDGKLPLLVGVRQARKILVLGGRSTRINELQGIAKKYGISKSDVTFLDYDEVKSFNPGELQYSGKYALILVGPVPHKIRGIGNFSSILEYLQQEGFPPVMDLGSNGLKITKTDFDRKLSIATETGLLVA